MFHTRNGNIVLEPLPRHALTAAEARRAMEHLAECVTSAKLDATATVTIRCFRNELMTREYAKSLYGLITKECGLPRLRVVDPTPERQHTSSIGLTQWTAEDEELRAEVAGNVSS